MHGNPKNRVPFIVKRASCGEMGNSPTPGIFGFTAVTTPFPCFTSYLRPRAVSCTIALFALFKGPSSRFLRPIWLSRWPGCLALHCQKKRNRQNHARCLRLQKLCLPQKNWLLNRMQKQVRFAIFYYRPLYEEAASQRSPQSTF